MHQAWLGMQFIARCGAKTRSGEPCKNMQMANGTGRCRMHGGKSNGSGNLKHGYRSLEGQRTKRGLKLMVRVMNVVYTKPKPIDPPGYEADGPETIETDESEDDD